MHNLVLAEFHDTMEKAFLRDTCVKERRTAWKIKLIEVADAEWRDLYDWICA